MLCRLSVTTEPMSRSVSAVRWRAGPGHWTLSRYSDRSGERVMDEYSRNPLLYPPAPTSDSTWCWRYKRDRLRFSWRKTLPEKLQITSNVFYGFRTTSFRHSKSLNYLRGAWLWVTCSFLDTWLKALSATGCLLLEIDSRMFLIISLTFHPPMFVRLLSLELEFAPYALCEQQFQE